MIEYIILGIVQGIAEWLPISSEGAIVLVMTNFFGATSLSESIHTAVVLHMGTFFSALVYFRHDVVQLIRHVPSLKKQYSHYTTDEKTVVFMVYATIISGIIAALLLSVIDMYEDAIIRSTGIITGAIGVLLLVTGFLQLSVKKEGQRAEKDLHIRDSIVTGVAQGFAALPGLSRSGLTISTLLLLKINEAAALRLSFLLSLPIVLIGNIAMQFSNVSISLPILLGIATAFLVGLASIHLLMLVAKRINFGLFVIVFGALMIISVFI